jgi:hypothetical protein
MNQVSYPGLGNIRRHRTKHSRYGNLAPGNLWTPALSVLPCLDLRQQVSYPCTARGKTKNNVLRVHIYTGWAKSRYTVIIFFFTGIVNEKNHQYYTIYYILYTYFWPTFIYIYMYIYRVTMKEIDTFNVM